MNDDRLATVLNAACQCLWLDRQALRERLAQDPRLAELFDSRPGLVAGNVVFLDPGDAAVMDRTIALITRALTSPAFRAHVTGRAPAIAASARSVNGGMLGFDFHLGGELPQLIEINTNPGGLLVNLELARAVTACCPEVAEPMAALRAVSLSPDEVAARIVGSFRCGWSAARGDVPLTSLALVDDDPPNQYLYPEFLLYQRLFEAAGWKSLIADAAALEVRDSGLWFGEAKIDLVYNRLTDFYLADERHAALRLAEERGLAVVIPNPAGHAHWADKRLLAALGDEELLRAAGLDESERTHLLRTIPRTEIVTPEHADELWQRRKGLFFKPVDGYGSKAAYRGDGLTRSTFQHILAHRYVAQAIAPTSMRRVIVDGQPADLRVDIRNYCGQGTTWLRAARLWRGQTTNFRTPGGGFAPVLALAGAMAQR
jgi:hypothetical protein